MSYESLMIHDVEKIEEKINKLSSGTYVKEIIVYTKSGKIEISLFADSEEKLRVV